MNYSYIANNIISLSEEQILKEIYLILRHIPALLIIFLISRQSELFHRISYTCYIFYSAIRNGNIFMKSSDINSWVFLSISAVVGSMKIRSWISVITSSLLSIFVLNNKWIESLKPIPLIACIVYLLLLFKFFITAINIVTFYSLMILFHLNTAIEYMKNGTHYSLLSMTEATLSIKMIFIILLWIPMSIVMKAAIQIFVKYSKRDAAIQNAFRNVSKYKKYKLISLISVSFVFLLIFQFYEPLRSQFYLLSFISTFIELLFVDYFVYGIFMFIFIFMCYLELNPLAEGLRGKRENFYIIIVIFSIINGLSAISKPLNQSISKVFQVILFIIPFVVIAIYRIEWYNNTLLLFIIKIISFFTFVIFEFL